MVCSRQRTKESKKKIIQKSTKGQEQTIDEQQQEKTRTASHPRDRIVYRKKIHSKKDEQESNDTDSSIRIDEHLTKEAAEERKKKY